MGTPINLSIKSYSKCECVYVRGIFNFCKCLIFLVNTGSISLVSLEQPLHWLLTFIVASCLCRSNFYLGRTMRRYSDPSSS